MADWVLIPCLVGLRDEFNVIAPGRDHASDGSIGDTAHQQETSDHNPDETGSVPIHDADKINEVHAIDVDDDLRTDGLTMEAVVQFLLGRCRSGAENRLRYIIYSRRIWDYRSDWEQKAYAGPSPHTEHAHFSASYDTAREASKASWHLEDLVAIDAADIAKIAAASRDALLAAEVEDYADPATPNRKLTLRTWFGYFEGRHITTRAVVKAEVETQTAALAAKIDALAAQVDLIALGGIDYAALAKAVNDDAAARMSS